MLTPCLNWKALVALKHNSHFLGLEGSRTASDGRDHRRSAVQTPAQNLSEISQIFIVCRDGDFTPSLDSLLHCLAVFMEQFFLLLLLFQSYLSATSSAA